jgi:hypothetical protein
LNAEKNEDICSDGFIIHEINEAHQIKMNCSNDLPYKDNTLIERLNLKKAVDYLIFFCYILMAFAFFNFLFNSQ